MGFASLLGGDALEAESPAHVLRLAEFFFLQGGLQVNQPLQCAGSTRVLLLGPGKASETEECEGSG